MREYKNIVLQLAVRLLIAAPFFLVGISGITSILSPFVILTGALIIARPLARLLAEPWGNLFYPDKQFDRPQPIYGIPEARRKEGHYEEALAGFRKIAAEYPDETQAWIEMLDLAVTGLNDGARALAIFQEGMAALQKPEQREQLAAMYATITSRLKARTPPAPHPLHLPQ